MSEIKDLIAEGKLPAAWLRDPHELQQAELGFKAGFDEDLHPRDHGKFTSGGGSGNEAARDFSAPAMHEFVSAFEKEAIAQVEGDRNEADAINSAAEKAHEIVDKHDGDPKAMVDAFQQEVGEAYRVVNNAEDQEDIDFNTAYADAFDAMVTQLSRDSGNMKSALEIACRAAAQNSTSFNVGRLWGAMFKALK